MEIDAIGSGSDSVARAMEMAAEAQRLMMERRASDSSKERGQHPTVAPNVTTSPTYSPVLYAQAAQFHLYTQAGTLAALASQHHANVAPNSSKGHHPEEIKAVDAAEGATVDTTV